MGICGSTPGVDPGVARMDKAIARASKRMYEVEAGKVKLLLLGASCAPFRRAAGLGFLTAERAAVAHARTALCSRLCDSSCG